MKKLKFLAISTIALLMALVINIQPTYAAVGDLYDDYNTPTGDVIELLENSEYQFNIVPLDGAPNNLSFSQSLAQDTITIEILVDGGSIAYEVYEGDSSYWDNFTTQSFTFETTTATDIEIYADSSTNMQIMDQFIENYDIQVIWLGNTEPVDTVAPEYTYSSAEIDTPYYDLVTVSEIQAQLQAVDDVDGDVSSSITVYEDQYTSITPKVIGDEYFVMYSVEDSSGNAAYLRVDINVIDDRKPVLENGQDTYQDGASFNFTWYDDDYVYATNEMTLFTDNSGIYDEYYGSITFNSQSAIDAGWTFTSSGDWATFDPEVPGTYTLGNTATDPSGNSITFTYNVTVLDNASPVINGPSELTKEAVGFSVSDVLASYTATDIEDGNLTVTVDSHNVTQNVIGSYSVTLSATDSFGIETTKTITVNLVDTTDPVFKVDGISSTTYSHTVYMSDTTTLQSLIDTITVIDAYDGDLTSAMVVPAFPNFAIPGTSTMILTVTDSSGNATSLNLEVTIADDIPPVINGAVKIVKGINETLTLSDILAELNVTDNVDSSLSLTLELDNYTGNSGNIGSYLVKYSATDTAGNTTIHDVRVWVVDNEAPAWILNDYFVNLGINNPMTRDELVSLLQSAGMIGSDISYTVSFLTDEYSGNESIPGVYDVQMHITFNDGSEDNIAIQLNVEDDSSADDLIIDPVESLSPFQKGIRWIKNAFYDGLDWIKGAWSWSTDKVNWVLDLFRKPEEVIPTGDEITTAMNLPLTSGEEPTVTELPYTPSTTLPLQQL